MSCEKSSQIKEIIKQIIDVSINIYCKYDKKIE